MQSKTKRCLLKTAACGVAAFVFCLFLTGAAQTAYASADKKAYNKGYRAARRGEFPQAEKIFRELLEKDAHDLEARLGLSFLQLNQKKLQGAFEKSGGGIMQG